jgi:hypothetical protein
MQRDARSSDPPRRNRALFLPSAIIPVRLRPLQDNLHRLVIVPLHFEVRCPAVALGRGKVRMTQKILDRGQLGVRVQKLGGEGMTEPVTGHLKAGFAPLVLDPLLDSPYRDRLPS